MTGRVSIRLLGIAALLAAFTFSAAAAPLANVTQVVAGAEHTCALVTGGQVYCWGRNDDGQLGTGNNVSVSTPALVTNLSEAVHIAAGAFHTCATYGFVDQNRRVKCWGRNSDGQLGDGTATNRNAPVDALGFGPPDNLPADQVAAGDFHTCVIVQLVIVSVCWGNNASGQLGDGTNSSHTTRTNTGVSGGVTGGGAHTCTANGLHTYCWGNNFSGELGDGTRTSRSRYSTDNPVLLPSNTLAIMVSAGGFHTCAVASPLDGSGHGLGAVMCWGSNLYRQLGDGTMADRLVPTQVTGLTSGFKGVDAGGRHSCAFDQPGNVRCWGANEAGQLGDGTTNEATSIVAVPGLVGVTQVAGGGAHTCALMGDRTVKCWGSRSYGQIGNGVTGGNQTLPTTVGALVLQAISFAPLPPRDVNTAPVALSATASSGLAPVFASLTPSVCGVSGTSVTMVAIGICTIAANQPGDNTYTAAQTVTRSFMVSGSLSSYPTRLANLSTRVRVGVGDDVAIAGFVIGGTSAKQVILRARGPSLAAAGIANPLADPVLKLYSGPTLIALNDDWQSDSRASTLQEIGFAPGDPRESALLMTLQPGPYTVIVGNNTFANGVGIVEVWEVDNVASPLVNLSTRGQVVGGEEVMIAGMIIHGPNTKLMAFNVAGPSLSQAGVLTPLMNPMLTLIRASDGTIIGENDDWTASPSACQFGDYTPKDTREPAMLMIMAPGAYTAIVRGVASTGIALVGVFEVPGGWTNSYCDPF